MKLQILLLLILISCQAQDINQKSDILVMSVGQIVPGKIDPQISDKNLHKIFISQLENKFLFIRLSTFDTNNAAIGLYTNMTGQLVFSCMDNSFDTCYIPSGILIPNKEYIILVMSNQLINYNLYTYWGDLQHVKPDQEIKFMFDSNDKTQLFHLDIEKQAPFQQIRIILRPQTARTEGDSLKIFANKGYKQQPTQEKHDYESIHVWNDAQAIFINKDQLSDEKSIVVYIVGNAKTVYILNCQFVRKDHHNINVNQNLYEYIKPSQQSLYHMKFQQNEKTDMYVVRFSVFTGEVQVGFYYDKSMINPFQKVPYQYMSDIQFHILKTDLKQGTKDMYMKVRSKDKASTFQLNMQGRRKVQSFQIFENLFQFIPVTEQVEAMHIYSHIWKQDNQYDQKKTQNFDISMIKVQGDSTLQFYRCKSIELQDICKQKSHEQFKNSAARILPFGVSEVGSKIIYSIQINQSNYQDINSVQKRALVIIHIKSIKSLSFVALQVSSPNKIRLLRQGRAFEDKVRLAQKKYYKYQNNNPNISTIKIHINQISGLTKIIAKRSDPRSSTNEPQIKLSGIQPNAIIISNDITKPIFIEIQGIVTSIYAISVNTIHQEHPTSSSLIMAQDISYDIKLLPYTHTTVQIHPIQSQVIFDFNCEGGSIVFCEVDSSDLCKQGTEIVGNKGQIKIDASNIREARMRLTNYANINATKNKDNVTTETGTMPSIVRSVKITMFYHSSTKSHCQPRKINKVYSELVKSGSCFRFILPLASDLQILASRSTIDADNYQHYFLCSQKVIPQLSNNKYIIRGSVIAEACKDIPQDMELTVIFGDKTSHQSEANQIRIDYSIQYANDIITLADGVAYYTKTRSTQSQIKTFFYEIIDEQSQFQIVLMNNKGSQYFFAKIVQSGNKYGKSVSESDSTITYKNSNYYSDPSVKIKKEDIRKANCQRNCIAIISVYSRQKPGKEIQFSIQVTQHQNILKQNQIQNGFLSKGSVKYYQFTTRNSPTDLFFKISDNNRKCVKSYLSNHPFPSIFNYIASQNEGSLTYKNAKKGRYYFALEATDDCPFSVSVSEGTNKLTKIQHGQYYDINLKQGEEKWFYLNHFSKSTFKIISLLKHGLVDIYVNKTELTKEIINSISEGTLKGNTFAFKNVYQNSLTIDEQSKQFCYNCYYLVYIQSKTLTQGSIFLGSQTSKISLQTGKVLFDQIRKQNYTTLALFYKVSKGTFSLNVHSGEIKLMMSYLDQQYSRQFEHNKNPYRQEYEFKQIVGKYYPIQIKIVGLTTPAIYSLQFNPFKENATSKVKLNPGQSSTLILSKSQQKSACLEGTLRSKNQFIYIISDKIENVNFDLIQLQAKLNGKTAQITKQKLGNTLSIKFAIKQVFFPEALDYQICLKATNDLSTAVLSVIQNQKLNLIPSDTELAVRDEGTFAILHNGQIIIDIFECVGNADIVYTSQVSQLDKKSSRQLDIIGISGQNHAMRVQSQESLFIKLKVNLATLLWMPIVQQQERGIGYYKYAIGKLQYATSYNRIKFIIGGVYKIKQTNTIVQQVKYSLYISNSRQILQKGLLCQMSSLPKIISIQLNSSRVGNGIAPQIQTFLQKKKITDTFGSDETLYFNVIADLALLPPNQTQQHQHYRFVYYQQIVLAELLKQNIIEQKVDINMFVAGVTVVSVAAIAILCVFVKWVVPALGRIKNRVLVEQAGQQNKDIELQAPPSSDRNQIATGTTDRMS